MRVLKAMHIRFARDRFFMPIRKGFHLSICALIKLPMTGKVFRCGLFLLSLAMLGGCTITTEGVQKFEVALEEVFPPSKVVASYRQLALPIKMSDEDLERHVGNDQKLAILKKWTVTKTLAADYGIPKRDPAAKVSVSELATKTNAYGAYTNLRPGLLHEGNYIKIGVHATVDGERLIFVQDRFLIIVRDLTGAPDPARRTMLINFGREISLRIPRDITDITLVSYLPYENRVPATERLDKEDPLGLGVLKNGGVSALYRIENRECRVYMAEMPEGSGLGSLMKQIKAEMEKEGPIGELGVGVEGYQGRLFKNQAMLAKRESVIFGCYGTMTEREMKNVMAGIDRRVKPYVAPKIKSKKEEEAEASGGPGK